MKAAAVLLALLTAFPAPVRAASSLAPASTVSEPLTITAPRVKNKTALKTVRVAGTGTAVAGAGLMGYAVAFGAAGPIGWAAGLIFLGGMSAYLSHRRLKGHEDFSTTAGLVPPSRPRTSASGKR